MLILLIVNGYRKATTSSNIHKNFQEGKREKGLKKIINSKLN